MSRSGEFRRYDAAKMSFDTILRSLEHEDAKANRLIVAMAFITAASALIFANLYTPEKYAWQFGITQMAWIALFFYFYLGLVLLGTLSVMAALGPKLNVPRRWPRKVSHLFFLKIAEMNRKNWERLFDKSDQELENTFRGDLIYEAHLLAEKNRYKVSMMVLGRVLYRFSFAALITFVSLGLTYSVWSGFGLAFFLISLIVLHYSFEESSLPEHLKRRRDFTLTKLGLNLWHNILINRHVRIWAIIGVFICAVSILMICLDLAL